MERLAIARQALRSLEEILHEPFSIIVRDATIQRFEYTCEAVWKAASHWLLLQQSLEERHPRGVFRALFLTGAIDESLSLALLQSVEDRNRTSHAYIESVAAAVFSKIPGHAQAFSQLLDLLAADLPPHPES